MLDRAALRAIEELRGQERGHLARGVLSLQAEALPDGRSRKKLTGVTPPTHRLRVGRWRAIYRIEGARVRVLDVIARKDLDRWMRGLR